MILRNLVDGEAERVGLPVMRASSDRDHQTRTVPRADDHVLRVRWAVHEIPRAQPALLAFHDQQSFARDDEKILLIRLPVIHRHRLARLQYEGIDAELGRVAPLALEVVGDDTDSAAALRVPPLGLAHVQDVPTRSGRGEPMLGLFERRSHSLLPGSVGWSVG
jgi:hypothetical protein